MGLHLGDFFQPYVLHQSTGILMAHVLFLALKSALKIGVEVILFLIMQLTVR